MLRIQIFLFKICYCIFFIILSINLGDFVCRIYIGMSPTYKSPKISYKFFCEICDYKCNKKSEYTKHISTAKHKILHNPTSICLQSATPKTYSCICGKEYKHSSTLSHHKKKCDKINNNNTSNTSHNVEEGLHQGEIVTNSMTHSDFKEILVLMMKENKEFQKSFLDIIPQLKTGINNSHNTITNNNTTNNQFNINMFLNEHCKNAMNLTDFINSLPITNETYDNTIENGLTQTLTKLVVNGLNNMDIVDRPIHCTDPSRKIMYVKDNDNWEKDNELVLLLKGIKDLSLKQRTMINKWQDANYGWNVDEDLQSKMTKIIFHSMTNIEDDHKETNKIIRAISKNTYLNNDIKAEYNKI
jgi:hypothetical protein